MNGKAFLAILATISALAAACEKLVSEYDIEIHVSRVWDVNDSLPERLIR